LWLPISRPGLLLHHHPRIDLSAGSVAIRILRELPAPNNAIIADDARQPTRTSRTSIPVGGLAGSPSHPNSRLRNQRIDPDEKDAAMYNHHVPAAAHR